MTFLIQKAFSRSYIFKIGYNNKACLRSQFAFETGSLKLTLKTEVDFTKRL